MEVLLLEKSDLVEIEKEFSVSDVSVFEKILGGKNISFKLVKDGQIIGFIISILTDDFCEIVDIEILKSFRRKGYGFLLMEKMISMAKKSGVSDVFLEVDVENVSAINLYKKLDFYKINVRKNYYKKDDGRRTDAVVMKLSTFQLD